MILIELAKQLNCSTSKAEEVLAANSLTVSDVDETFIPSLKAEMDKSALSTGVSGSSQSPTSQSLATQPIATNSSIKGGKLAPKKEGAIVPKSKKGSSKVAKTQLIEKLQIEKASVKSNIQAGEISVIEEAATAGYSSAVGVLAASVYLGGIQMRFADEVNANMSKAMGGMFDGIGEISGDRYQGVFDYVRKNEPHQEEETADDWSF